MERYTDGQTPPKQMGGGAAMDEDEASVDSLVEVLVAEHRELLKVVSDFDGRLLTIKSWSVTVGLVTIGLGFQQGHYALFGVASLGSFCFWLIEAITKRHQMRYYPRMRDIEVAVGEMRSFPAILAWTNLCAAG